jgi:hypothetical protein
MHVYLIASPQNLHLPKAKSSPAAERLATAASAPQWRVSQIHRTL